MKGRDDPGLHSEWDKPIITPLTEFGPYRRISNSFQPPWRMDPSICGKSTEPAYKIKLIGSNWADLDISSKERYCHRHSRVLNCARNIGVCVSAYGNWRGERRMPTNVDVKFRCRRKAIMIPSHSPHTHTHTCLLKTMGAFVSFVLNVSDPFHGLADLSSSSSSTTTEVPENLRT